ncbi:MAG TPA: hypothetical protein DCQ06_11375 [Myxococcales bacterium]|nr:hypothetical protein [Myxococcales bacterium]HAN32190.1 hypothetical protein [Myxococcales bacterium]
MLEQFLKLQPIQKAGVLAAILALVFGGGYFLVVDPEMTRADEAKTKLQKVQGELQALKAVANPADLDRLRKLKDELVERNKDNRKLLPTHDELPDFIEQVEIDARNMGLRVRRFERFKVKQHSLVNAIPVKMEVRGSMIDFIRFLRVYSSATRRIIHLKKLSVQVAQLDSSKLAKELKASQPIVEKEKAEMTAAEKFLETIQLIEFTRKRTQIVATFTAYAFIWTGTEPAQPDPPEYQGKRKRT